MRKSIVLGSMVLVMTSGCYTTRVYTGATPIGGEYEDRQWFTIGGLAPLSSPAGSQCPHGVSRTETSMGAVDILINIGLTAAGSLAGGLACANSSSSSSTAGVAASLCASAGAGLAPFLFSSRTVRYTCAAGPASSAPSNWQQQK